MERKERGNFFNVEQRGDHVLVVVQTTSGPAEFSLWGHEAQTLGCTLITAAARAGNNDVCEKAESKPERPRNVPY